jgi:hypothetical protein
MPPFIKACTLKQVEMLLYDVFYVHKNVNSMKDNIKTQQLSYGPITTGKHSIRDGLQTPAVLFCMWYLHSKPISEASGNRQKVAHWQN